MEQEDDRSVRRPRLAVEHMNPVSFNAMVRRQRNVRNVSHGVPRNVGLLVEIEQSDLSTKSVEGHNGGCEETAAIKVQGPPNLCWLWLSSYNLRIEMWGTRLRAELRDKSRETRISSVFDFLTRCRLELSRIATDAFACCGAD